jgi:hypothetical protein
MWTRIRGWLRPSWPLDSQLLFAEDDEATSPTSRGLREEGFSDCCDERKPTGITKADQK